MNRIILEKIKAEGLNMLVRKYIVGKTVKDEELDKEEGSGF